MPAAYWRIDALANRHSLRRLEPPRCCRSKSRFEGGRLTMISDSHVSCEIRYRIRPRVQRETLEAVAQRCLYSILSVCASVQISSLSTVQHLFVLTANVPTY